MSNIMFVPDMAVRSGDFSGQAPIYDPLTNRPNPAFNPALPVSPANPQFIRDQFPGNKIPANRINSVSQQVLAKYVVPPNRDDPTDNYLDTRAHELRKRRLQRSSRSHMGKRNVGLRPLQPE